MSLHVTPGFTLETNRQKFTKQTLQFQIILLCRICSYLRFGAIGSITYLYTCFVIIPNIPNKDTATKSNHHGLAMPVGPALEATRPSRGVFSSNSHVHLQHLGYSSVSSIFRFWKFCSFVWNYIPDQQKACMLVWSSKVFSLLKFEHIAVGKMVHPVVGVFLGGRYCWTLL